MRKIFNKFAIILTTSSLALPATACVYNFYINSATRAVIKSYADQTSSVLKSLILAKEKSTDNSQTIQDMLAGYPNSSIRNQTGSSSINTWEEFSDLWGFNKNIAISGFDPKDYFLATGQGSLTQQVNTYRNINNILNQINLISGLNVANNRILYNLIKSGDVKDTIVNFLNTTKEKDPSQMDTITILLKNIVIGKDWDNPDQNAFTKSVTDPLTSMLNNLTKGLWTATDGTPSDKDALKAFMDGWKDPNGHAYSQWNTGSTWELDESNYRDWNQSDYNFYRSGVLVNHLFYQIGKDNQIINPKPPEEGNDPPEYKDRYLGDIITEHITYGSGLVDINIDDYLLPDIMQYVNALLTDPSYIITLIEAVVPLIKEWLLEMPDITQGVTNLTFGKLYPNDPNNNSYNAKDILNNVSNLLLEPENIIEVLKSILNISDSKDPVGTSLTYDIKIKVKILGREQILPLGGALRLIKTFSPKTIEDIINAVRGIIDTDDVKNAVKNIVYIYDKWIKQYDDRGTGINFDLVALQDFLLNDTNGFIVILNRDLIPILYEIMINTEEVTDPVYFEFYQKLGGQLPPNENSDAPLNFRPNSLIDLLKSNISNTDTPLGQLFLILLGNSSDNNTGIFSFVIESNNQWLADNYTKYFDVTNKSIGQVYNQTMTTNVTNNEISDTLTYNFVYKINGRTYYFWARCKSLNNKDDFTGTKDFYFTDIKLEQIK